MAEWRIGRGWDAVELEQRLKAARLREVNFSAIGHRALGWHEYYTEAVIGYGETGTPREGGAFLRAWDAIRRYEFSDPRIVTAHFDPTEPLRGRTMLLELKVMGLRYLCGTRVEFDRILESEGRTVYGYRYDTLEGHIERGAEWFLLAQDHSTGRISFRIHANWRLGDFPNAWSRWGFQLVGRRYQLAWHRLAYLRLREIVRADAARLDPVPFGEHLVHSGETRRDPSLWLMPAAPSPALRFGAASKKVGLMRETARETTSVL